MANLHKLSFLLVAIVGLVASESLPQPKRGDVILGGANDVLDHSRSKVLIEKPVLLEVNNKVEVNENLHHEEHNSEIQLARPVVDEVVNNMAPLAKLEPASNIIGKDEVNINNENKDSSSALQLEPIPLIMPQMPFGMPAFMQQILDSLKLSNPLSNGEAASQTSEESGTNREDGVRHGSLTILLMKSLKPVNQLGQVVDDKSLGATNDVDQNGDGIKMRKVVLYKFMPRFRLGGKGDPDSDPNFLANTDNVKTSVHLLGKIVFSYRYAAER